MLAGGGGFLAVVREKNGDVDLLKLMAEPPPNAPRPTPSAPWNVIVRKKTLDEHQGNLRQVMNYPGTGPFKHVSRQDKEVWIMERNPNYWNKGLPYVDRLEIYNLPPFSPELGSSFLSGKVAAAGATAEAKRVALAHIAFCIGRSPDALRSARDECLTRGLVPFGDQAG